MIVRARCLAWWVVSAVLIGCGGATPEPEAPGGRPGLAPAAATDGKAAEATADPANPPSASGASSATSFACAPVWVMPDRPGQGNVAPMPVDDPALLAARREAAATLDTFRQGLAARLPPSTIFSLKVGLPTRRGGGALEHIWVSDVVVDGTGFRGVLDNDPVDLDLAAGDAVAIRADQVEDWMILDVESPQRICGGFTSRVVLARQAR